VTAKTLLSTYCSLVKLKEGRASEVIYLRNPIESVSKSVGFLAGSYEEKMRPYGLPIDDHLKELLADSIKQKLIKDQRIKVESVGFVKGRTYNVSSIIADEAEDLSVQEIKLLLTRMGHFSTLFLIGDTEQSNVKTSGFDRVFNLFNDEVSKENGIFTFEFGPEDCMRSPVVKFILEKFTEI
jgi:phosphate starvation-inducible PhoH-like protein